MSRLSSLVTANQLLNTRTNLLFFLHSALEKQGVYLFQSMLYARKYGTVIS